MIEDQDFILDGVRYRWSYDSSDPSPKTCWQWMDADRYLEPSVVVRSCLTRAFVHERARDMIALLDESESGHFVSILLAMGVPRDEVAVLYDIDPSTLPKRAKPESGFATSLPPKAHTPFNSPVLRDWLFEGNRLTTTLPAQVGIIGHGPFEKDDFDNFLKRRDIEPCDADGDSAIVVLGREGWDRREVDELIDQRVRAILRIYSQEMFVTFLAMDSDPFYAGPAVLEAFKAGHPGLEFISQGWPDWVTTYVSDDRRHGSSHRSVGSDWPEESPLHVLGYRVGKTGESVSIRRLILRRAFTGDLPIVGSPNYMQMWGEPGSAQRLKKMADNISTACRNMKNRSNGSRQAIEDWESDLVWLHDEFYHGHFRFCWPDTYV